MFTHAFSLFTDSQSLYELSHESGNSTDKTWKCSYWAVMPFISSIPKTSGM